MEKKLRRDFKERQKIKEEAKLLGKEYMDADEAGKLKHGDDYRGKIIHEKDRFQDKIHEKESKRNSKNELLQGSSKRKVKQLKNVVKDKETDTSKEDNKSPLVSGDENSVFTSLANDETIADEIVSAPKSIKTEKEISFEEQSTVKMKKSTILWEKTLIMTVSSTGMTMTLETATILNRLMMWKIIFIPKKV